MENQVKSTENRKRLKRPKPLLQAKFDWEALGLAWAIGIVCSGLGVLIIWATMSDPEGPSNSMGYTVAQRLARVLPDSAQEKLAVVFAALMILFGVICILLGFISIVKFQVRKWKNDEKHGL